MLIYPNFDPVAFSIGQLSVHWYGLMYLLGYVAFMGLGTLRLRQRRPWDITNKTFSDFSIYFIFGVFFGGRIGYFIFYQPEILWHHPLVLFKIWEGGMSFHGGAVGVLIAIWIFSSRHYVPFLKISDFIVPLIPLGLGLGRIGNFINGELWGRATNVPWGMVFLQVDVQPRHPSQIYQGFLEGIVLLVILWIYSSKQRRRGQVTGLFCVGYSIFRLLSELAREPDAHIGFDLYGAVTRGQILSIFFLLLGLWVFYIASKQPLASK